MAFDTYKAVQDLKKVGLGEEQASAIVAVIRWAVTGQYTNYAKRFANSARASDRACVATPFDTESN